jgi:hypothetical protein
VLPLHLAVLQPIEPLLLLNLLLLPPQEPPLLGAVLPLLHLERLKQVVCNFINNK